MGNNLFSYCENNPVNRNDPTGAFWKQIANWFKRAFNRVGEYLSSDSNIYGSVVGCSSIVSSGVAASISNSIKNAERPSNIGAGVFAKNCADELKSIAKFEKGASKALSIAGYGVAAIDVGTGIYNNISNGASTKKIVLDATVDMAITAGSIWAAGFAGGMIGGAVGTVVPVLGNVIGAAAGFVAGVSMYALTDMMTFSGKTAREWAKEGVNQLW